MESFNHLKFAELEYKIIEQNNSYPGLAHSFSDSGKLSGKITAYKWHVLKITEYKELLKIDFKNTDVFFGLFVGLDYKLDNPFFKNLSLILLENEAKLIKADTTKSPYDFSFVALCVCNCQKDCQLSYFGSLDSYVEGIHFSKEKKSYQTSELAAVSDVLTSNAEFRKIYSLSFNSNKNKSFFSKAKIDNINFWDFEIYIHLAISSGRTPNYNVNLGDNIYLVGYAGYSKALNYKIDFNYIYNNVISIRERVFNEFENDFYATDVSDGVKNSLRYLEKSYPKLKFEVNQQLLNSHCKKISKNIIDDYIQNGGDDYSLILISKRLVKDKDISIIGKVT